MVEKNTKPLVTIITPTYNGRKYIIEVIESVLSQDYPNFEYIVLDDGSSDNTEELIKKYSDRIRYFKHSNMGESRTVNKGFDLANGDYIGVVNSDDPILPGAISRIVSEFKENPEVIVVYPDFRIIDQDGETVRDHETHDYSYFDMVANHHCIAGPCAFFKRGLIDRIGGRNHEFKYVSDFEFWLKAGLIGPFKRIPEIIATYRIHSTSATESKKGKDMANEHIRLMDEYFKRKDIPKEIMRIKNRAYSSAYYTGGFYCGENSKLKRRYYCKALLKDPFPYLFTYRSDRLPMIIPVLIEGLPPGLSYIVSSLYRFMFKLWMRLK